MTALTSPASALADLAPVVLAETVLDVLRRADRPLSAHATAEALCGTDLPRPTPGRAECIRTVARYVAPVLADLRHAGRARREMRGGVHVYEATCPNPEIEGRIAAISAALGGRPVRVVTVGADDPLVEITAPLSRIEGIGR